MNKANDAVLWKDAASPLTGERLVYRQGGLEAADGSLYKITDGIADLLDARIADEAMAAEMKVFDEIPLENVCYFRQELFGYVVKLARSFLNPAVSSPCCVEVGGGEGYFAKAFLEGTGGATSYVCDLSVKHLKNADGRLLKIRCDARKPYLAESSVDVAAFWVSLHHFSRHDMKEAFATAVKTIKPGGLLLVFEPNDDFFPRKMFYKMRLSREVYFDEEEKGLSYEIISNEARKMGLEERFVQTHSPPYSLNFLKNFRFWPLFYLTTEFFHLIDAAAKALKGSGSVAKKPSLASGSYVLCIYKKP